MSAATGSHRVRFSPVAHLAVVFVYIIPVFLAFDPYTPCAFVVLMLINLFGVWHLRPVRLLRLLALMLILPAGLFILNLAFTNTAGHPGTVGLFGTGVNAYSLNRAEVLSLRAFALITISIGYLLVTDPRDLVNALMQQVHLSPRVGFSIYVAWNAIPLLRGDMKRIQEMHRVRLRGRRMIVSDIVPTGISLLAGAIRHAQRAAISMAVRGVESEMPRSYLKESRWRIADNIFVAGSVAAAAAVWAGLAITGLFVPGLG